MKPILIIIIAFCLFVLGVYISTDYKPMSVETMHNQPFDEVWAQWSTAYMSNDGRSITTTDNRPVNIKLAKLSRRFSPYLKQTKVICDGRVTISEVDSTRTKVIIYFVPKGYSGHKK